MEMDVQSGQRPCPSVVHDWLSENSQALVPNQKTDWECYLLHRSAWLSLTFTMMHLCLLCCQATTRLLKGFGWILEEELWKQIPYRGNGCFIHRVMEGWGISWTSYGSLATCRTSPKSRLRVMVEQDSGAILNNYLSCTVGVLSTSANIWAQ